MELIAGFLTQQVTAYLGVTAVSGIVIAILTWILNKIPTKSVRKAIYDFFFKIGSGISGFFNAWKYTKGFWEKVLEPWFIGFWDMIVGASTQGLFDGMRSDNKGD